MRAVTSDPPLPGTVIILNGTSSSGKSSILRALQDLIEVPLLDAGLDRFLWMLPRRYLNRPLWDEVLGLAAEAGRSGTG
jgi:chloramphenicol 3-O-phosphotransferase